MTQYLPSDTPEPLQGMAAEGLFVVKLAVFLLLLPIFVAFLITRWRQEKKRYPHVEGFVHPGFKKVAESFSKNLARGWERDGAAFCLYHKGECVVDLWGGYSDKESRRPWSRDTLQIVFSTSKALGAVCIAHLVDKGLLQYDQKINSFWPSFRGHGKEDITVEMVLRHTAGLAQIEREVTFEDAMSPDKMAEILENQKPNWQPGSAVGYHAFSYGWLVDQIIRRVDPAGRGSGQFWREEIAQKHDLDIHIGLPLDEAWRVARFTLPSIWNRIDEFITDPEIIDYFFVGKQIITGGMGAKVARNPPWLQAVFNVAINNPDVYVVEQPAALAIGTARDMARFAQLLIDGSIISQKTLSLLDDSVIESKDLVSGSYTVRGRGVTVVEYAKNTVHLRLVGHAGIGGQNLRWDKENHLALCYLSNGLKSGLGDRARSYVRIMDSVMECLQDLPDANKSNGM